MPSNGNKLPNLYNSSTSLPRLGQDSIASSSSPFHRSSSNIPTEGQRNIRSRIGHRRIDVSKRPLGSKPSNNSVKTSGLPRSMEGNDSSRNWDSEGGRPKSPQRQPAPQQTKKSGFKRLLQRPSFDGLMPFQRAPRDGSYEKSLPTPRNHALDAPKDKNIDKSLQPNKTTRRFKTSASLSQDAANSKPSPRLNTKTNLPGKNHTRQSSPTLTRLLRRRRSHDRNGSHQESSNQNPSRSSTESPPIPVPLSHQTTPHGPNEMNSRQVESQSPQRNDYENVAELLTRDFDDIGRLRHSPNPPEVPLRDHVGSPLIDLSPREDLSSTTNTRHSLYNEPISPRDPYSTFFGGSRRHSNPVPPPRTSASLSPRDLPTSPRDPQRQPNSVFRQHPLLRTTTEFPRPRDPPTRPRANSEQTRTSSPRFRNLLSRRGSSSSNSSRENSQSTDNTNTRNEREGGSSSRSFWRNSLFGRLGSAERRSRSRSDSAASNNSQDNTTTQQASTAAENNDTDFPGFPFRQRGMRYSGLNRNDSTSSRDLPNGPRIIRLTLGQSGADIGSLMAGTRGPDGSSINAGDLGLESLNDELGMQIALIGTPSLMSPPMDLATVPPRLLLSFLLQGRRELGNEFVELVLENLLLSILARHMMEVGGQGGSGGAHPPATQDMIDKLEGFIVEQEHVDEDLNCAICHVEYELSEKLSKLPCAHFFHPTCISIWLKKSATCPVCRFKLPRPSENPTEATD